MTAQEDNTADEHRRPRVTTQRKFAVAGLAAGLLGGGAAGMVMTGAPFSAAATTPVAQADEPTDEGSRAGAGMEEHLAEVLKPLVDDGTINQEQADAVVAALVEAAPDRPLRPHRALRHQFATAAEAIGVEPRDLADELRDGSTIAEVATEHGVEVQSVIDAMVAEVTEWMNKAVAEGRITEEQAAERIARATERIADGVNNGFPLRSHGGGEGSASPGADGEGGPEGGEGGT